MTMVINGSGSITGLSAGGLPDGTIQQADLATNVAGNGPAFFVYRNSTQSFTSGVWTKVALNAEDFDTANAFDSTTNYRFQPTVAGYYQFTGNVSFGFTGTATITGISVWKNGTAVYDTTIYITQSTATSVLTSKLLYLNGSTDYVELYMYCNAISPGISGSFSNYFIGAMVRAA